MIIPKAFFCCFYLNTMLLSPPSKSKTLNKSIVLLYQHQKSLLQSNSLNPIAEPVSGHGGQRRGLINTNDYEDDEKGSSAV